MRPTMKLIFLMLIASTAAELEWKFTKFPEPVTAPDGDVVTFECSVNVPGERLAWRWRLDKPGEPWVETDGSTDREKISTRLQVNVKEGIGNTLYQCVVWYGAISLASDPARLTIARIDLSRNTGEKRVITAPLHNTVVLHCREPISEPPAELSWWKEVKPGVRQPMETPHGVLVIHNASTADSGTYGCTATNDLSGQEVDLPERTYLRVQHEGNGGVRFIESEDYVGEVTDGVLTVPIRPNGALRLWCGAVGTPPPRVTWYRGEERRVGFRHDYDLVVQPFTAEDEGIYSCAVNGNDIRRSWKVIALQPPYWEGVAYSANASEGTPGRVACGTPVGQPTPEVTWMLNAEPVAGKGIKATGSELRFARVEKKHAGALQCFACNALGCAHDAVVLTVVPVQISQEYTGEKPSHIAYQPPKHRGHINRKNNKKNRKMVPPSRPTVTRMSDESVMVSWSNSSSGMPIQIFKVQYREETNSSKGQWYTANSDIPPYIHSYEVDGLIPDRYYKFRIAAVYSNLDNTQGRSSPRFYLQRGGIEGPRAPDLIAAEPVSSSSVRLNWTWSSGGGVEAEGFYVYYRAVSSAGKYEKVTVEGGATRAAILGHLAPDTAYEWKLQSYTAQAPSEFSKILVAKTLRGAIAPGTTTVEPPPEDPKGQAPAALVTAGGAIGATALLVILVVTLLLCRRARRPPANKEKGSGPESGANGYIPAKVPITITANPMHAESGDGSVEMSFLHNNNCGNPPVNDDTLPRTRKNGPSRQYV